MYHFLNLSIRQSFRFVAVRPFFWNYSFVAVRFFGITVLIHSFSKLISALGSANPRSHAVLVEPFSASGFKGFVWIFATTTKICNKDQLQPGSPRGLLNYLHIRLLVDIFLRTSPLMPTVYYKKYASAPSIFRAITFGRWVVTHSLANIDFHDHRPAVHM